MDVIPGQFFQRTFLKSLRPALVSDQRWPVMILDRNTITFGRGRMVP
jgi:hypothetical protein